MKVTYLKDEKNEAEIELDNLTIAEIMRAYLNKDDSVSFAAWKREHPSKNPVLKIKTKNKTARKAIEEAISHIEKDADKVVDAYKTSKTK